MQPSGRQRAPLWDAPSEDAAALMARVDSAGRTAAAATAVEALTAETAAASITGEGARPPTRHSAVQGGMHSFGG